MDRWAITAEETQLERGDPGVSPGKHTHGSPSGGPGRTRLALEGQLVRPAPLHPDPAVGPQGFWPCGCGCCPECQGPVPKQESPSLGSFLSTLQPRT